MRSLLRGILASFESLGEGPMLTIVKSINGLISEGEHLG